MKKETFNPDSNLWSEELGRNFFFSDPSLKEGCYGIYFKLSKRIGIKVITAYKSKDQQVSDFTSSLDLKGSKLWSSAEKEFLTLKKLQVTKITPRAIKLTQVLMTKTNLLYPAIIMEHIEGEVFEETEKNVFLLNHKKLEVDIISYKNSNDGFLPRNIKEAITTELRHYGIKHKDLHNHNVLVSGNNIKIIDFGNIEISS